MLNSIKAARTALIVTHRLASARLADRILVPDGGRIAEDGTHRNCWRAAACTPACSPPRPLGTNTSPEGSLRYGQRTAVRSRVSSEGVMDRRALSVVVRLSQ